MTNNNFVQVGGNSVGPVTLTVDALSNSGTLDVEGGGSGLALLDVTGAAAPSTWTGIVNLIGDAVLEYSSGQIGTIGSNAQININGADAFVADAGSTSSNSALSGLTQVSGQLSLQGGAELVTSGSLTVGGDVVIDTNYADPGNGSLTVDGTLTNNNFVQVGGNSVGPVTLTVDALSNSGTLDVEGGGSGLALLDVTGAAAPSTWTGIVNLIGDAVLEYSSGQIGTIGSNAQININGADAFVADAGSTSSNSALSGLTQVSGQLSLQGGAELVTSGSLTVGGDVVIDTNYADPGNGSLTVDGTLTNNNFVQVGGNSVGPVTLTADALSNSGTLDVEGGGSGLALLDVTGAAAPSTWTGIVNLSGDALLEYSGTSQIATIGSNAQINITGAHAFLADAGSTGRNSALTGLTQVSGELSLQGGAQLSVTGSLTNSGALSIDTNYEDPGGGSLTVGGTLTNAGDIYVGGNSIAPATLSVNGLSNTGTLDIGGTGTVDVSGNMTDGGSISGAGTLILTGTFLKSTSGTTTISTAFTNDSVVDAQGGTLLLSGSVTNDGTLETTGGTLDVTTAVTGSAGMVSISGGGIAEFGSTFNQNVTFSGAGTLELARSLGTSYAGTVTGFGAGDALELTDLTYSSGATASWAQGSGSGTLTVSNGSQSAMITLAGTYITSDFAVTDASGNDEVISAIDEWTNTSSSADSWNTAPDWSTGVPTSTMNALIDLPGAYTLALSGAETVNSLIISDPNATLSGSGTLSVVTTIDNSGTIEGQGGTLTLEAGSTIANYGTLASAGGTLFLEGTVSNSGTIEANGGAVYIDAAITGSGTIESIGSNLYIRNTTLALTSTVEATASGPYVGFIDLSNATLTGGAGTLETASGGEVRTVSGDSVFDGTAAAVNLGNSGGYGVLVNDNTALTLKGTINNSGNIQLDSAGDATNLVIDGNVTLEGGGQIEANGSSQDNIIGSSAGGTLTNVDNTIDGSGQLGVGDGDLTLVNDASGVIESNSSLVINTGTNVITNYGTIGMAGVVTIESDVTNYGILGDGGDLYLEAPVTNPGMIEATGVGGAVYIDAAITGSGTIESIGSNLYIRNTTLALTSTVEATASGPYVGFIDLSNATLTGGAGTLETASGGEVRTVSGDSVFDGTAAAVNLGNSGGYGVLVNDNTALTLKGTINNSGNIQLDSAGDATNLVIDGNVTLEGGGQIEANGSSQDNIIGSSAGGTLTNFNNTIDGSGQLGVGDGDLTLVNDASGVIESNSSLVINTGTNVITNYGTIGMAGVVTIESDVTNYGILGDGGDLYLEAPVTNPGMIEATGVGGAVYIDAAITGSGTIESNWQQPLYSQHHARFDLYG